MSAPFHLSTITIVLKSGTHAMVRNSAGPYMPDRWDNWSQNVQLIIQSENSASPSTVRYKLGGTFQFLVGASLTI